MISKGTTRGVLLTGLLICAAGFSACSDDVPDTNGSGGADAKGGKTSGTGGGGKANSGGTSSAKGGAVAVGGGAAGGAVTAVGGTTGAGGSTVTAGTGGTTAVAGSTAATGGVTAAGNTGQGGATGGVTAAGGSGAGGTVIISTGGAPQMAATGVAVLTVPLAAVGQGQRFNYQNYDGKGTFDIAASTLNILACAPGALGGNLHVFFTSFGRADSRAFDIPLSSIRNGFTTMSIPVPAASGSYDPTVMMLVRIEVEAGADFGSAWQTPATLVYIDRIWTSNGVFNDNFVAAADVIQTSGVRNLTGATVSWTAQIDLGSTGSGGSGAGGASSGGSSAGGASSGGSGAGGASSGGSSAGGASSGTSAVPAGGTTGTTGSTGSGGA